MTLSRTLKAFLTATLLYLVLIQPNHPDAVGWDALFQIPLELPAILLLVLAFGTAKLAPLLWVLLVTSLAFLAVLKIADFVMLSSLNRRFNLVGDLPLVGSFYDLIVGNLGQFAAIAAVLGALIVVAGLVAALWWVLRFWSSVSLTPPQRTAATIAGLVVAGLVVVDAGARVGQWSAPFPYPGNASTTRYGVERFETAQKTIADLRAFKTAAVNDPFANRSSLYDLVDRDVLVVFVESYGRTSLDTPFYADLHRETLAAAQAELNALGLAMSSTVLTSPTRGGQSWLAHATFANGLWVPDQTSYRAVLSSGRQTLYHLARDAGFHTAAVMPQITLDWPEADVMGFETILAAADLGYAGLPFNWVTMPDQFTFAAMDRLLRDRRADQRPYFIQMALGSSHAPWVPIPDVMDWDDLGDGTIFNPLVTASETPREVWKDRDRVRAQYRLAVDYALQTIVAYAVRHADNPPLMIVLGDHQTATSIALDDRPHVPMHIIGPPALVDLLADDRFTPGLLPNGPDEPRRMDEMRAHILDTLSSRGSTK